MNKFKNENYYFVIEKNYNDGKFNIIEGRDKGNKFVEYKEVGIDEIFKSAKIGDTIKKEKDSTTLYIIKKDTILAFPRKCK
ncbi:MAG: hypothetical protein HXX09_04895 [Bacteroidetes bacterium]|nr:hypothetical protein [Bacteroidota bacterium]